MKKRIDFFWRRGGRVLAQPVTGYPVTRHVGRIHRSSPRAVGGQADYDWDIEGLGRLCLRRPAKSSWPQVSSGKFYLTSGRYRRYEMKFLWKLRILLRNDAEFVRVLAEFRRTAIFRRWSDWWLDGSWWNDRVIEWFDVMKWVIDKILSPNLGPTFANLEKKLNKSLTSSHYINQSLYHFINFHQVMNHSICGNCRVT